MSQDRKPLEGIKPTDFNLDTGLEFFSTKSRLKVPPLFPATVKYEQIQGPPKPVTDQREIETTFGNTIPQMFVFPDGTRVAETNTRILIRPTEMNPAIGHFSLSKAPYLLENGKYARPIVGHLKANRMTIYPLFFKP